MQSLFADRDVIAYLKELHAEVAIPVSDFTPQRAAVVRRLNEAEIDVIAWMELPRESGSYLNADNAPEAANHIADFEKWSNENNLKWAAVGLDIEPNFVELSALKAHRWRLITTLFRRSFDRERITRARQAYSKIIAEIQSRGYTVQTYQMPFIPAERRAHSSLLDRLLGTVDVQGNEEYLMLYTSFARPIGSAMIWSLGRDAQAIAIGSTDGETTPGVDSGPLDWPEFSRDLIVASSLSGRIGIYDLEGCVAQGFLARLRDVDWSQSVIIPAESIRRAERFGLILRTSLWIGSNLLYLLFATLAIAALGIWRRRVHRRKP